MVKAKSKGKRSASGIVDYAPRGAQSHMQKAPRGVIAATVQSRQTVEDFITSFVGLDVHKDSIAMAVAEAGRDEPRFLGTVSPQGTALHKALAKLGKPAALMIVCTRRVRVAYRARPVDGSLRDPAANRHWI